jgi:hypothetical protein
LVVVVIVREGSIISIRKEGRFVDGGTRADEDGGVESRFGGDIRGPVLVVVVEGLRAEVVAAEEVSGLADEPALGGVELSEERGGGELEQFFQAPDVLVGDDAGLLVEVEPS